MNIFVCRERCVLHSFRNFSCWDYPPPFPGMLYCSLERKCSSLDSPLPFHSPSVDGNFWLLHLLVLLFVYISCVYSSFPTVWVFFSFVYFSFYYCCFVSWSYVLCYACSLKFLYMCTALPSSLFVRFFIFSSGLLSILSLIIIILHNVSSAI